jgi:F-type H+-transporting ATPase subunit b
MKHVARSIALTSSCLLVSSAAFAQGSVPQMDPSSFPNQLFWLAITFVALYVVVSKLVVPSVSSVLDARERTIADAIAKAEAFKQHAEQTRGNYEAGSQAARAKATELLGKAQSEAAKAQSEAMERLNTKLEQQTANAQAELKKSLSRASQDVESVSAELARVMVEKLLGGDAKANRTEAA